MIVDKNTFLARAQRGSLAVIDWETWFRCVQSGVGERVDVVFISNMRHELDRKTYLGKDNPPGGHFNGPRISFKGVLGRTRALNVLASDLYRPSMRDMIEARKIAKGFYLDAANWAEDAGAKVILSGASLKDLFGKDAEAPKEQNPGILFTKGDNGTGILFWRQVQEAFMHTGLGKKAKIGLVCPYNTNGNVITNFLVEEGYENVILFGSKGEVVRKVANKTGYQMVDSYAEMGKVDAVICCSHSSDIEIGVEQVDSLRKPDRKLLILSVTQPPNPKRSTYVKREDKLLVISTGNGYAEKQRYVIGDFAAKKFGFASQHCNFGCYMEAIALAYMLKNGITKYGDLCNYNWFDTNEKQMLLIESIFKDIGISPFPMFSYAKPIESFDLDLGYVAGTEEEFSHRTKGTFIGRKGESFASFL